jgi:hypothetical protein
LIEKRANRYLPILSSESVADADLLARCAQAIASDGLTVPCRADNYEDAVLPTKLRQLTPATFSLGWTGGLKSLMQSLEGVPPSMTTNQGTAIALRSYVPQPVTKASPEPIFANVFPVTCPANIQACDLARELTEIEEAKLRKNWAFVKAYGRLLLSFENPPASVPRADRKRLVNYPWREHYERYGKRSTNVVKELVRRSMDVASVRAGLQWCDSRHILYFPSLDKPLRNVTFTHVDGRNTRVAVTGLQSYGSGDRAIPFRYQLSPGFRVGFDESKACWLTLRVYVRVTDDDGIPYEGKAIGRRRKKVGKSWWNKHWFARTVAVMQALSENKAEVVVGRGRRKVSVSCAPLGWECPNAIDYHAVEALGDFQEEIALLRFRDDEAESEDEDTNEEAGDE